MDQLQRLVSVCSTWRILRLTFSVRKEHLGGVHIPSLVLQDLTDLGCVDGFEGQLLQVLITLGLRRCSVYKSRLDAGIVARIVIGNEKTWIRIQNGTPRANICFQLPN